MNQFRIRIGRVISKGGADLKVIDGKFEWHDQVGEVVDALKHSTGLLIEYLPDMAGYAAIAWDSRGRISLGYRNAKASPYSSSVLPAIVADALRDDLVTNAAVDWINSQRGPR